MGFSGGSVSPLPPGILFAHGRFIPHNSSDTCLLGIAHFFGTISCAVGSGGKLALRLVNICPNLVRVARLPMGPLPVID
jgi:hypothetical protein